MGLRRIDLTSPLPEITWVWQGLIPRGFVSVVGALPGEGKTALLSALAWQATRPGGGVLLSRPVVATSAVYVDFDSATGDGRALRSWIERHKRAFPDGDQGKFVLLEPDADTYGLGDEELKAVKEAVLDLGAGLVVVDSFMATFPLDQVKAHQVQAAFFHLRRLALETGAAVVVIDHLPKPMTGEKAGARGLLGSIAKVAQARAVHILTRVPPTEVDGRHVLRWEVLKNSFAPIPDPFGAELLFEDGTLKVVETPLPEGGNPRKDKAKVAVLEALKGGVVVPKGELVQAIVHAANVHTKTAERYLEEIAAAVGLQKVSLPGQGKPVGYRLPEAPPLPGEVDLHTLVLQNSKTQESPSPSQKLLEQGGAPKLQNTPKPDAPKPLSLEEEGGGEEWVWS